MKLRDSMFAGCLALVVLFQGTANADTQAVMGQMLDTYINVTPASGFDTQRRNGVTLGSVVVRSRVMRPNFINFTPPSVKGGCGGFDLMGGSFSFINSEQLQQFLRSIASNALNYAFTLAIEGVCPTCWQHMGQLREWGDKINGMLQDSCYWATKMGDKTGLKDWHDQQFKDAQAQEAAAGSKEDWWDATDKFLSKYQSDRDRGTQTPQNAVVEALRKANVTSWYGALGDQDLVEVAQSVTGTFLKTETNPDGSECTNEDGAREYCVQRIMDTMDVEQLVNGTSNGAVTILRCQDGYPPCLNVNAVQENNWPGLKEKVRTLLFGPAPAYTGGLVDKMRTPGADLTPAERAFIEAAPLPVLAFLKAAAANEGALRSMGERIADLVAVAVARDLMLDLVNNVRRAFEADDAIDFQKIMLDRIHNKMDVFAQKTRFEDKELENVSNMFALRAQLLQNIRGNEVAAQPVSITKPNRR